MARITKSDEQLLACLQDGELTTSELVAALQISARAVGYHTLRLVKEGLIKKPQQGHHVLTAGGRLYINQRLNAVAIDFGSVGKVIEKLPTEHHKAFLRLLLSAIVAKYHLFNTCDQGWPSFIAGGPTKTMKTALAGLICRLFGWDPGAYIKHVQISSQNELIGRRFGEGTGKFGFTPSCYFGCAFICLDELDKAKGSIRKQALYYLQGTTTVAVEGTAFENHALPLVTLNMNSPQDPTIVDSYKRRAVVFETWPLTAELKDVDLVAQRIFGGSIPRLNLDKLAPLKRKLSTSESHDLRELVKDNLNDEGWKLTDLVPLELLTRGRVAFGVTITEAVYQTVNDYLLCSETTGWTKKGWRGRLRPVWKRVRGNEPATVEQPLITAELESPSQIALQARVKEAREEDFAKADRIGEFKKERQRVLSGFMLLKDHLNEMKGRYWKRVCEPERALLEHYIEHVKATEVGHWEAIEHYDKKLQEMRLLLDKKWQDYKATIERSVKDNEERKECKKERTRLNNSLNDICRYKNTQPRTPPGKVLEMLIAGKYVHREVVQKQRQERLDRTMAGITAILQLIAPPGEGKQLDPRFKTVTYHETVYIAAENVGGGEFTADQLNEWGKPAVQNMLARREAALENELKALDQQLLGLNVSEKTPAIKPMR